MSGNGQSLEMPDQKVRAIHDASPSEANSVEPAGSKLRQTVEDHGSLVRFAGRAFREAPVSIRLYPSEILHQSARLVRENSLVIIFMTFMVGAVLALTLHFLFANLGITSYIGGEAGVAVTRGPVLVPFCWIVAAKIGCGIAAELGAMKISEEIDALHVMGIRPIAYLVSSRVVACLIVIPALWTLSMVCCLFAGYVFNAILLDSVSTGGFISVMFLLHNLKDFVFSLVWSTVTAVVIVIVGCYFGYTAKGGPLGVGHNTARSMLLNMVLISITAVALVVLFWGNAPNAGIGN